MAGCGSLAEEKKSTQNPLARLETPELQFAELFAVLTVLTAHKRATSNKNLRFWCRSTSTALIAASHKATASPSCAAAGRVTRLLHSKQCGTANLAHRRITAVLLLLRTPQSRSWLRAARRPMSALAAKPSPEEIERRRRAKRAERAANPKKKVQQTQKKQRDPAEEARALREFRIAPLIDAGANLQSRGSYDDVVRQLRRASLAGVAAVVLTGCDVDGSTAGKDFCERWAAEGSTLQLGFTAGVHPHDASKFTDDTLSKLEALSTSPFCVAMGECGLDYDRMFSPREVQLAAFRAQCALAKRLDRSLFVHVREKEAGEALGAYRDAVAVMTEAQLIPEKVCVHCFTGGTDELAALVDFGCRVGFTGFLGIAKRSGATREAVASLKDRLAGRLLLETDAPFMLPDKTYLPSSLQKRLGLRGGKNEPAVLPAVCGALADALGRDAVDVARETTDASRTFFGFDDASSDDGSDDDRLDDEFVAEMQRKLGIAGKS